MPNLNHIAGGGGEWFREDRSPVFQTLVSDVKKIITYPLSLHHKGYEEVERFMKERIDENGTLYSYATASFYMIYALLALGHSLQSSMIQKAIAGITSYMWKMESGNHVQNSPSTVWDTALLSYALQEAHVLKDNKMLQNATAYLLKTTYKKLIGAYMLRRLLQVVGVFRM